VAESKQEYWAKKVAEQEAKGQTVRQFCREQGTSEYSFYAWRRRLKETKPVRFALIEPKTERPVSHSCALELELASGERLRIGNGIDAATLRVVLEALRG
jgi:transposase-like protein